MLHQRGNAKARCANKKTTKDDTFFVSQTFKFNEYIINESSIKILIFVKDQFNSVGK